MVYRRLRRLLLRPPDSRKALCIPSFATYAEQQTDRRVHTESVTTKAGKIWF